MGLLGYLVTSDTRKELLNLLWVEGVEASGHQLAQLANAAYSAVHSELVSMQEEGLVTSHREGRADLFAKNNDYPFKKTLLELLEAPKEKQSRRHVSDNDVRFNLAKFGAPLVVQEKSSLELTLEETLAHAFALARKDSTVSRALPVALAKNKNDLDLVKLEYLSRKNKVLNVMGFYLDLTSFLSKDKKLHAFAKNLLDRRRKKLELFFVNDRPNEFEKELAEKNTPALARHWFFLMNMGLDSFESLFKKTFPKGVPA